MSAAVTFLLRLACLACALGLGLPAAGQTEPPRRVALVIGNNAYASAPLQNPVNDAKAMAAALQAAGFAVTLQLDAAQSDMLVAVREFGNLLHAGGSGTVGLFYFAGHGMQIKGRNFLIPIGANIEQEDEVAYQALDAQAVLDKMEAAGNGTNLMVLDACRNNPFARSFRSAQQGLAAMDAPVGTLVAFATAPGSIASDGQGANGLYTTHLLEAMRLPGLKVEDVFKQVRGSVRRASLGRQVPMEWSSLEGDFYFVPGGAALPAPTVAAALPDPQGAVDDALWVALKDGGEREWLIYLNRFPAGRHAREARTLLNKSFEAPIPSVPVAVAAKTPAEPAPPKSNAFGIAEGDRYEFRTFDRFRNEYEAAPTVWRVDRIKADGSASVNDGSVELDPRGQLVRQVHPVSKAWFEWSPPLPIAEAAHASAIARLDIETQFRSGAAGQAGTTIRFKGTVERGDIEQIATPAGTFLARRVDVTLRATGAGSGSYYRRLTFWYAQNIALPVAREIEERVGGNKLDKSLRTELTAYDVLSARPVLAGGQR
jgi:uncharacterized caspase-like protein